MCTHVLGDPAGHARLDVAVDMRISAGKVEPEGDVAVPASSNVLERGAVVAGGATALQELLETVADDRIQQRLLAAEVVVERRCPHPRPLGDLPGRDRPARSLVEQLGRGEAQPGSGGEVLPIGVCSSRHPYSIAMIQPRVYRRYKLPPIVVEGAAQTSMPG